MARENSAPFSLHIYCHSASEDVKVGGVLSTCVAGDGEDDFPNYTLSLLDHADYFN